jgi:predicted DNA-binding transcriptional regulator YafY
VALLLADGAAWTAQAVADHANVSKRTALRALSALAQAGRVMRVVKGKDVRYLSPARSAIASRLLLLGLAGRS